MTPRPQWDLHADKGAVRGRSHWPPRPGSARPATSARSRHAGHMIPAPALIQTRSLLMPGGLAAFLLSLLCGQPLRAAVWQYFRPHRRHRGPRRPVHPAPVPAGAGRRRRPGQPGGTPAPGGPAASATRPPTKDSPSSGSPAAPTAVGPSTSASTPRAATPPCSTASCRTWRPSPATRRSPRPRFCRSATPPARRSPGTWPAEPARVAAAVLFKSAFPRRPTRGRHRAPPACRYSSSRHSSRSGPARAARPTARRARGQGGADGHVLARASRSRSAVGGSSNSPCGRVTTAALSSWPAAT